MSPSINKCANCSRFVCVPSLNLTHKQTAKTDTANKVIFGTSFLISFQHKKITFIHSCSARSLTITHAVHTLPVMIIIIQHCFFLTLQYLPTTPTKTKTEKPKCKRKLSSQFSTKLRECTFKKKKKKHFSAASKDCKRISVQTDRRHSCSSELKSCYVQN